MPKDEVLALKTIDESLEKYLSKNKLSATKRLAERLSRVRGVETVYYNAITNTIFLTPTDRYVYDDFVSQMKDGCKHEGFNFFQNYEFNTKVAVGIIFNKAGKRLVDMMDYIEETTNKKLSDVSILFIPSNWEEDSEQIQKEIPHFQHNFFKNNSRFMQEVSETN